MLVQTKFFKHVILTFACTAYALSAMSQASVVQTVDSVGIMIGQQAHLTIDVTAHKGARIIFPALKPSHYLIPGVELLGISLSDTVSLDNDMIKVSKTYTITSFDEKLYAIPGLKIKIDGKNVEGNTVALKVITMDVDTLHPNQFFPPKDVQSNPFLWSEWSLIFWLSLLVVILSAVGCYLFIRLKQNKPIIRHIRIIKHVPAHQRAMNEIDKIKSEHMNTSENQKEYYTLLTDTLRQYIQERFGFNAMEMTSSEIIFKLQETGDQKMINELRNLFQTADLVKFAKYSTLINENDLNLVNAVNFIDQTKIEDQPTEERIIPKLSKDDVRSKRDRQTAKILLYAISAVVVSIFIYMLYSCYELLL